MKVVINETCAGSNFAFKSGEVVESSDSAIIEILKELIRAGHATELKSDVIERAVRDTAKIEKR